MPWVMSEATTASAVVTGSIGGYLGWFFAADVQIELPLSRGGAVGCCNACHVGYYQRHKLSSLSCPAKAGHSITASVANSLMSSTASGVVTGSSAFADDDNRSGISED